MSKAAIALTIAGAAVLAGVAYLILLNNKQALSLSQQSLAAAPPVTGASTGVASGSGPKNTAPPQNKGYGDKIINTGTNLLGLANSGADFYKKVWG